MGAKRRYTSREVISVGILRQLHQWHELSDGTLTGPAIDTDSVHNVADHVIGTDDDLKSIFENDLSAGDSVSIGPGIHEYMNVEPTVDDVTVYGAAESVLLLSSSASTSNLADTSNRDNLLVLNGVDGWRFTGVTFDGNSSALSDYDANQEDALNALVLAYSTGHTLQKCIFRNTRQNGLRTLGGSDHRVLNCEFRNNRTHILAFWGDGQFGTSSEPTTDSVIRDCEFHGTVTDMTAGNPYAIYLSNDENNWTVAGNYIYGEDTLGRGINIFNSNDCVVRDNHLYSLTSRGIAFQGASSNNNKILDNYIECPNAKPIYAGTDPHTNNRLAGNTIIGAEDVSGTRGIDLRDGSGWRIHDNHLDLTGTSPDRGIWIDGTAECVVTRNHCIACNIGGTADDVQAANNTIDDADNNGFDGFRIGGTNWRIGENEIIGTTAFGTDTIANKGTRVTLRGVGHNGTDNPRSAGDWNGNGREGVVVKWDNSGTIQYDQWDDDNSQWVQIA